MTVCGRTRPGSTLFGFKEGQDSRFGTRSGPSAARMRARDGAHQSLFCAAARTIIRTRQVESQIEEEFRARAMTTMLVDNLSHQTTVENLNRLFAPFGTVRSIDLATDIMTGRCGGFGFVKMSEQEARAAQAALHRSVWGGRTLGVRIETKTAPFIYQHR